MDEPAGIFTASIAQPAYSPAAALPPKLVKKILDLEFVEMSELLPDAWHDDPAPEAGHIRRRPRRAPVTDIILWLECFARMASVIATKFPSKSPELWAYQTTILRAAKNYEGSAWVAYDRQYRREALSRQDLNWSACNARLYSEAFTGRAKLIPRCQHCLSEAHASDSCPMDPNPPIVYQTTAKLIPTTHSNAPQQGQPGRSRAPDKVAEICRNYNWNRCRRPHCRYLHICSECYYPHPYALCPRNSGRATPKGQRSRSPARPPA